jgi:DNA-binding SARP family transcriptional activator
MGSWSVGDRAPALKPAVPAAPAGAAQRRHARDAASLQIPDPWRARCRVAGRLALLNAFALSAHGLEIRLSQPAQRLLAFLALHEHPVARDYVAGILWLDSSQSRAAGSLRSALWTLRRTGCELVEVADGRLRLASSVSVDVREGTRWARRVLDPRTPLDDLVAHAVTLHGDILPDWYDDWVVVGRERFRELSLHALEILCARLTAAERFGEAMDAALAAVEHEPLRESAHRAIITVHIAEGNKAEALETYRRFRDRMTRDLGLPPSARMEDLVRQIKVS